MGAFQSHAPRWNTAREGVEGHNCLQRVLALNGEQHFQAMPKMFARQGLTHLADAALVPCRPGESKWLGIPVLRAQELGERVS